MSQFKCRPSLVHWPMDVLARDKLTPVVATAQFTRLAKKALCPHSLRRSGAALAGAVHVKSGRSEISGTIDISSPKDDEAALMCIEPRPPNVTGRGHIG